MKQRAEWLVKTYPNQKWVILVLVISVICLSIYSYNLHKKSTVQKGRIESLQNQLRSQYMIWQMDDDGCYKQIMNNTDGIIRLKFSK